MPSKCCVCDRPFEPSRTNVAGSIYCSPRCAWNSDSEGRSLESLKREHEALSKTLESIPEPEGKMSEPTITDMDEAGLAVRQRIALLIDYMGCDGPSAFMKSTTVDEMLQELVTAAVFVGRDDILRPLANIKDEAQLVTRVRTLVAEHFK